MKQTLFSTLTFLCFLISGTLFSPNVGVGTFSPLQKLHVEGNSYIKDSLGLRIVNPAAILDVNGTAFFRGNNRNSFADSLRAAVEFFSGRNAVNTNPFGLYKPDIAFNFGGPGGGYRHFIATRHDNQLFSGRNGIDFYVNHSSAATGSSAPGIGNIPALSVTDIGLGLGTINPYYKMDIVGYGFPNQIHFQDTATYAEMALGTGSTYPFIGTVSASKFSIKTSSADRIIISETGNVGIGNINPFAPLQFSNALVNRKVVLWQSLNNDHRYLGFGVNLGRLRYQEGATWDSHVFFAATSDSTSQELMRITGTGNVGIGNANSFAPLHFSNELVNRKVVLWQMQNNDHRFLGFGVNLGMLRYQVGATWDSHVFFAATSDSTSQELMRISGTGNVGIGTDNPLQKLHVQGHAVLTGNMGLGKRTESTKRSHSIFYQRRHHHPYRYGLRQRWRLQPGSGTRQLCI